MKRLVLFTGLLLAGCADTHVVHVPLCPPVMEYSKASQMNLSHELRTVPADSQITRYLLDYKRERDMLRACRKSVN